MNDSTENNNTKTKVDARSMPKRLDPEDAQHALEKIENILRRQENKEERLENKHGSLSKAKRLALTQQYNLELSNVLEGLHPADIAFILESLRSENRHRIWNLVNAQYDGDILLEVEDWVREELIASMNFDDLLAATEDLDADELADLAPDLPPEIVAEVQKGLSDEERNQLLAAMGYPEGTVGSIMDFEMVRVREDITLEVVARYLRRLEELPAHTDQLFVVDRQDILRGTLALSTILVNDEETMVKDVMETNYLCLDAEDDDAEAASAFERYDLVSAPVIDQQSRLIGRVTIDDIVDVIHEDSRERDLSRAGLQEDDVFLPVSKAIRNRAPWLIVNLITASTASLIASQFEGTVEKIVILAFLMSIVAGIGGNSGNQTMTMVIRAIAVGRVNTHNAKAILTREFIVTILVGIGGSLIAAGFAWYISHSLKIALVMAVAMVMNMLIGATIGVIIPVVRAKFDKDPALGSSVMLTFVTDSLGFFIFLGLAQVFLL
ncbi:magnesium transporter [Brackiella oedipodis]|uniref:magnesium transporter n=1 Tax=Brackiella oedipodis TaxID=124225 RepID=UPI00048CC8C6|nr:magnesium transporter [Brackiella oedipodis]